MSSVTEKRKKHNLPFNDRPFQGTVLNRPNLRTSVLQRRNGLTLTQAKVYDGLLGGGAE